MSPRHMLLLRKQGTPISLRGSKDRVRYLDDHKHHPMEHPVPHPSHHSWPKGRLGPRHTPHSHLHEEALGPHTDQPGPIRFSKIMTKTGAKIRR